MERQISDTATGLFTKAVVVIDTQPFAPASGAMLQESAMDSAHKAVKKQIPTAQKADTFCD